MAAGFWSASFRFGIYDLLMPVNYDRSVQAAFTALKPAATDHILDGGCGSGRLLVHACDWLKAGGRLTGVDIDQAGLAYAQRQAARLGITEHVQLRRGDLTDLSPLHLPPFDGVVSHFAVYTIPGDEGRHRAVQELARLVKPGGRLVVVVPSEHYTAARLMADAQRMEKGRTDVPAWRRLFRRQALYRITYGAMKRIEARMVRDEFHRYTEAELREHLAAADVAVLAVEATYGGCGWRAVGRKG